MNRARTAGIVLTLLFVTIVYAVAEDITLTTYYPSPRGVYQNLQTQTLIVNGNLRIASGGPAPNSILTSTDALGNTAWIPGNAVPTGMVGIFPGPCPAGWTRVAFLDGRTIRGALASGGTGGADTHTHMVNINHTHWVDPGASTDGWTYPVGSHSHETDISHSHGYGGTTSAGGGGCAGDSGFNSVACDGHSHDYGGTTDTNGGMATSSNDGGHWHSILFDTPGTNTGVPQPDINVPTTAVASGWPPYADVVFCQAP